MAKRKATPKKAPAKVGKVAQPEVFQQAHLGFYVKRAGWDKSVTGDGKGGLVWGDGSAYKPAAGDLEASDWSVV